MKIFERSGWTRRLWRQVKRKAKTSSGAQIVLDLVALLGTGIQVALPAYWAYVRSPKIGIDLRFLWLYLAFVVYAPVHKFVLARSFKPRRLRTEEQRRPMRLAQAISKLAVAEESRNITETTLSEVERAVLVAITSDIEARLGDEEGQYLNASLIIPDGMDENKIVCINRAHSHREYPKKYAKNGRFAWESIRTGKTVYQPDYKGSADEPYRSILCFPLLIRTGDNKTGLGCVSIDHSKPYELDDLRGSLEIFLLPYLRILELALIHRAKLPEGPTQNHANKPTPKRPNKPKNTKGLK